MHVQSFDETYFTALYGNAGRQTWADRVRDRLIDRLVTSHHTPHDRPPLLDVGCGYGFLVERFRNRYTLYSTDISEHALAVARQRLPEVTFACGSAEEGGPLFPITFQVALLINVLEHLAAPEKAVKQMWDSLSPGGICVVHIPTINNWCSRLYYRSSYSKDKTHVFRPSGAQVTKLFRSQGFELLEESYAPHKPGWLWRALKPFPPFLAVYRRP